MHWFAFTAYNAQTAYGFGTDAEASRYCDIMNEGREINLYGQTALTEEDVAALEHVDIEAEGVNLGDALAEHDGVR